MEHLLSERGSRLLELADLDFEDLPETICECKLALSTAITEVSDVRRQMADERAGLTSRTVTDHRWAYRAQRAATSLQHRVNALKWWKNVLLQEEQKDQAEARKAKKKEKADRHAEHLRNFEAAQAQREKTRKHLLGEAQFCLKKIREHLKTLPEEDRQTFYNVRTDAQNEYRRQNPLGDKVGDKTPEPLISSIKRPNLVRSG